MKVEREDRFKRREYTLRISDIDLGKGLIIASVILVLGSFTSKLVYDYIQQQRIKRALNDAFIYMQSATEQASIDLKRSQEIRAKEQHYQSILSDQERKNQRIAKVKKEVQEEKEQLLAAKRISKQCQFWSLQHKNNPSDRTALKRSDSCGFSE